MKRTKKIKKRETRLLPSDFQKRLKANYGAIDNTQKRLEDQNGFFTFPEELKGSQEKRERQFLVFYFDSVQQYEMVREYFEIKSSACRSHPDLDTRKLYRTVRKIKIINNEKGKN